MLGGTGFERSMESVSLVFEAFGVLILVVGFVLAAVRAGRTLLTDKDGAGAYDRMRSIFGKSVLLGLEVLVAADLIRTIAVEPNLTNLTVLLMLVVIRTFLSWALDVELDGSWPWRKKELAVREAEAEAALTSKAV
jgi:uncharacterized membrane protein